MKIKADTYYKTRFFGFLIDFLCMFLIYLMARVFLISDLNSLTLFEQVEYFLLVSFITTLFLTTQEASSMQTTIGKFFFHYKVVKTDGTKPSFLCLLVRNGIKVFTCIYLFMFFFSFEIISSYLYIAIFLSVSTNAIWHDFMTIFGNEQSPNKFIHNEVSHTLVIKA
jgi:uncharacterized RDD family membrane protein YckC